MSVDGSGRESLRSAPPAPRWSRLAIAVLLLGLLITGGLCTASRINYLRNERRQVKAQAQLAADAVAVAPVDVQRRIGRATALAAGTGRASLFDGSIKSSLPTPFGSAELFEDTGGRLRLCASLGRAALLPATSAQLRRLFARAAASGVLAVTRVATPTRQRLGYAVAVTVSGRTYVGYAEQLLPGSRRVSMPASSPLTNMDYAVYFGPRQKASTLMETNVGTLPLTGTVGTAPIRFGDRRLTLVLRPRGPLLGRYAESVAWAILGAGTVFTLLMALLTDRLARRRAVAEELAAVSERLYRTERSVAETLQDALLPHHLPTSPCLRVATRYLGGTEGIEVGGDWYDLIRLSAECVFFTVGDVSGRGLSAATMMSRLRHSIAAYAVEGTEPAMVLAKVSALVDVDRDGHFATALCGILDLRTGTATVASAGHPPLVQVADGLATPLHVPLGPPLGVGTQYVDTQLSLTPGTVLLAYTDGLIERRDAPIDAGIAHLARVAGSATDLEAMLDAVLADLLPHGAADDDTAILALQWTP